MTYLSSPEETIASFEFSYDVAHTNRESKTTEPQKERDANFHFAQKQMMQFGYKPDAYARHLSLLPSVPYIPPTQSIAASEINDRDMFPTTSIPEAPVPSIPSAPSVTSVPRRSQDTFRAHIRKRSATKGVTQQNLKHNPMPSVDIVPTPAWNHPFSSSETLRPYRPKSVHGRDGPRRPVWELVDISDDTRYAFDMEAHRPPPTATGDNGLVTIEEGLGRQLSVHPLALNFTSPLDLGNTY
jgi:hypothetical protein